MAVQRARCARRRRRQRIAGEAYSVDDKPRSTSAEQLFSAQLANNPACRTPGRDTGAAVQAVGATSGARNDDTIRARWRDTEASVKSRAFVGRSSEG